MAEISMMLAAVLAPECQGMEWEDARAITRRNRK